jgi:curved DNA-binding protein CbpA
MPAATPDPYAVLGVSPSASAVEIRAAYLALVARYHPDLHQGNPLEGLARERMAEINQAYEQLSARRPNAARDPGRSDPGAPAPGGGDAGAGARPARSRMTPMVKWALLIFTLPFLIRGGAGVLRAVFILGRDLFAALSGLRGTPASFILALLAVTLLLLVQLRRHRRNRNRNRN